MAGNPTVKLVLAGDASGLDRAAMQARTAMVQTGASADHLKVQLEETGRAAKGTKELMRGAGDAAALMGGQLGNSALQAGLAVGALKDLAKGAALVVPELRAMGAATLIARGGIIALGVAAAVTAFKIGEKLAEAAGVGQGALDAINTQRMQDEMLLATKSVYGVVQALNALGQVSPQSGLDSLYGPGGGLKQRASVDDIGGILDGTKNLDGSKIAAKTVIPHGGAGGAIADAAKAAKDAAAKAASDLKQAKKTVADAVRGIVDAFSPNLDTTGGADGFSRVGLTQGAGKSGLIANLKKQADDTLKLRKDLEKLAKMGLDPGLLTTLVAGGLASLPAAEDLLKGGRSEIGQANYYAGKINLRSNTIATEQTARALTKKDKQTLDINVKGGDAELVKLIRKWVHGNGGSVQSVLGG